MPTIVVSSKNSAANNTKKILSSSAVLTFFLLCCACCSERRRKGHSLTIIMTTTAGASTTSPTAAEDSNTTSKNTTNNSLALPRIVTLAEIEGLTTGATFHHKLVAGLAQGFERYARGDFCAPPIQTLGAPPMAPFTTDNVAPAAYAGQACIKSGYFRDAAHFVVKVAAGGHPLPNSGLMQLYAQRTGRLQALLLDEGLLTELRTAALGALAVRLWRERCSSGTVVTKLGMLGTGIQARYQLAAIAHETDCRHVVVYGRTDAKVTAFFHELQGLGWTVDVAATPPDLLRQCEIVITTTPAREPLLSSIPDRRTRLLVCIGSDAPGKSEVDASLLKEATLRVADHATQSRERGEFQGMTDAVVNLGDWILSDQDRLADDAFVVVDSSGVALQDCVIAQMVYESL
jgi:ornithine cyclodeaminase/alanine dehydrogenase-like protein (mu-crystallin family)